MKKIIQEIKWIWRFVCVEFWEDNPSNRPFQVDKMPCSIYSFRYRGRPFMIYLENERGTWRCWLIECDPEIGFDFINDLREPISICPFTLDELSSAKGQSFVHCKRFILDNNL